MTAITTIGLNKWEHAETSSYSDLIGPNEIKMPINPVLIAAARSWEKHWNMHMQMRDWACCAVQDPNCKMLGAYLHNDYDDDDGRVDNDDADKRSFLGCI